MQRLNITLLVLALAGCSAGSGTQAVPNVPTDTSAAAPAMAPFIRVDTTGPQRTKAAIGGLNSVGSYVTAVADQNAGEKPHKGAGTGVCRNGREFYAPDRKGDPDSTESLGFFDRTCTQLARDTVRIYTSTGSNSETVSLTISNYAQTGGLLNVKTSSVAFTNATFGQYGVPVIADGFVREASSQNNVGSKRTLENDSEFIVQPASGNVNAFCSDWAGYNATGIAALNETFGWAGGVTTGGTRTINADGSITWVASRHGTLYDGPIGSLSIVKNAENSTCPISAPAYAIAGGSVKGSSIGSISVTFDDGWISSLNASRVSVSGGYSLTMASNSGVWPTNPNFITGVVSYQGTQVATFAVNTFGDGTLTITKSGKVFDVAGWIVVR